MDRSAILIEADELPKKPDNPNSLIFGITITNDMRLNGHIAGAAFFDHGKFSEPGSDAGYGFLSARHRNRKMGRLGKTVVQAPIQPGDATNESRRL